jgi:hypothetical protein
MLFVLFKLEWSVSWIHFYDGFFAWSIWNEHLLGKLCLSMFFTYKSTKWAPS